MKKRLGTITFFIAIFLLLLIITTQKYYLDYDLWARLIAGMGVIEGHQVLKSDFLSYTPTHLWFDHEYGSGVIFYFFLKYFGGYSLLILQAVLLFSVFFILIRTIKNRGVIYPYNPLFWLLIVFIFTNNNCIPIRCQLFSYLFFTLFIYLLEHARNGKAKLLYLLPIITVIWNNLHGGVVSGIGLILLYTIGESINKKPIKHFVISLIISLLVLVINPWGLDYIKFLIYANTMERPYIIEWLGLFSKQQLFNHILFKFYLFAIVGLEMFVLYKKYKENDLNKFSLCSIDKTKFIVLLVTLYLSISHVKLIPFFIISSIAFCYEDFRKYIETRIPKIVNYFCVAFVFIICLAGLSSKYMWCVPVGKIIYPHREIEFIKQNNLKGNILADFGYGSFIAYKLYPNNKIYIDGRYEEVYDEELMTLLKNFYTVQNNWDEILKKYPTDIIILDKWYDKIENELQNKDSWIKVFETNLFSVFIKKEMQKDSYIQPTNNIEYYKNTLFDTSLKF